MFDRLFNAVMAELTPQRGRRHLVGPSNALSVLETARALLPASRELDLGMRSWILRHFQALSKWLKDEGGPENAALRPRDLVVYILQL